MVTSDRNPQQGAVSLSPDPAGKRGTVCKNAMEFVAGLCSLDYPPHREDRGVAMAQGYPPGLAVGNSPGLYLAKR